MNSHNLLSKTSFRVSHLGSVEIRYLKLDKKRLETLEAEVLKSLVAGGTM